MTSLQSILLARAEGHANLDRDIADAYAEAAKAAGRSEPMLALSADTWGDWHRFNETTARWSH